MNTVEKSAKTREEAIEAALAELNATISEVEIEVLDEGSKGLFGLFGSRLARVRVTKKVEEERFDEDELNVAELLGERREEPAREQRRPQEPRQRAPRARGPRPEKPQAEKTEKPQQEKAEKPADKPQGEKKARPEPVRRVNPERKSAPEAPKAEAAEPAAAPAEEPETFDALTAEPAEGAEAGQAPARKRRRRRKGGKGGERAEAAQEQPEQAEEKPLPPKAAPRPLEKPVVTMIPAEELDPESQAGKAKAFLQEVTRLMGVEVDIQMGTDEEGNLFGAMTGDTLGILIGRRGETLDALQYLTSLRVNKGQDHYTRVTLDTENYRAKREDTLIRLANRMANRAVKTGRRVAMEPMNPYERRIIHSALQANENVDTHSEGEDPNRHVVITVRK